MRKYLISLLTVSLVCFLAGCVGVSPNFKEKDEAWRVEIRHVDLNSDNPVGGMILLSKLFAKTDEFVRTEYDQNYVPQFQIEQEEINKITDYLKTHEKAFLTEGKNEDSYTACFDISINFYGWVKPYRILREDAVPFLTFIRENTTAVDVQIQIDSILQRIEVKKSEE